MAKRRKADSVYIDLIMGRKSLKEGFSGLKYENSISDAEAVFAKFTKNTTKARANYEQIMFPETYEMLRYRRLVYQKKVELERELAWGRMILSSCSKKICAFLECRRSFENQALLGNYEKANR